MEISDFLTVSDNSQLRYIDSITSTHDFLLEQASAGNLEHGVAIFCGHQTAGKGRSNATWLSMPNQNLLFSMYIELNQLNAQHLYLLNMMVTLAIHQIIINEARINAEVKWPNDMMIEHEKVAGIKINNVWEGQQVKYAIISLGLNLNQTEWRLNHVTSLSSQTGKKYIISRMASLMQNEILDWLSKLNDHKFLKSSFNEILYKQNQDVQFILDETIRIGQLKMVDTNGNIWLEVEGDLNKYAFNQIKLSYEEGGNH